METGPASPTPDEARELLAQLAGDESAVRYPPLPRWFYPVMAALVAGLHLVRMLPSEGAAAATLGLGAVAVVLGSRHWLYRDGVTGVTPSLRDMLPFLVAMVASFAGCALLADATGATWVWVIGAAFAAAVVLLTGRAYRREYGDAR